MDRTSAYLRVAVYIALCSFVFFLSGRLFVWLGGYFAGVLLGQLLLALAVNWICVRIYVGRGLSSIGLWLGGTSAWNFALGLAGGMGSAALVLGPPLLFGLAELSPAADPAGGWSSAGFTTAVLLAGSAGEEILFHGFAFQTLFNAWGPHTTVFTVAGLFAALHGANPNSTYLALLNTAGFGVLFGYAFLRAGDLWTPIGLHFGWNFTLPLFGVNVSGLTMRLTGREMRWNIGALWSGGEYGPEGGVLTTMVLAALAVYLWKAPLRNQMSEGIPCAAGSLSSS